MGVDRITCEEWRYTLHTGVNLNHLLLQFCYIYITTLRILFVELARATVTSPDKAQSVPVEPVCGCTVFGMRTLPVNNLDAVFVIDDAAIILKVELV